MNYLPPFLVLALFGLFPAVVRSLPLDGFYAYQLSRLEDSRTLYSSTVWLKSSGSKLSIFRAIDADPLGGLTRCGGLGCNLDVHEEIGALTFKQVSGRLRVVEAEGFASFLLNSTCGLEEGALGYRLGCRSKKFPGGIDRGSLVLFSPGS
ncbi:hypothetical protein [Synechococcus sp. MIT S9451]|uniref:hypothetical protein n=1 Tax=Synechococcus sp. MIT S9451 TaxID=3082543 RepID=UPI0039B57EC0